MYINHEKKYIFIGCAKTASTSILNAVRPNWEPDPPPHIRHMGITQLLNNHPKTKDYFKFAFARNPWDRIVSCYYDFTQDDSHHSWSGGLLKYKSFEDFCLSFGGSRWREWVHFLPLSNRLSLNGKIFMDFVGRYENLQNDFNQICGEININKTILPVTRKSNRQKDYRKYFTPRTKDIVGEYYAEDLANFNYNF